MSLARQILPLQLCEEACLWLGMGLGPWILSLWDLQIYRNPHIYECLLDRWKITNWHMVCLLACMWWSTFQLLIAESFMWYLLALTMCILSSNIVDIYVGQDYSCGNLRLDMKAKIACPSGEHSGSFKFSIPDLDITNTAYIKLKGPGEQIVGAGSVSNLSVPVCSQWVLLHIVCLAV